MSLFSTPDEHVAAAGQQRHVAHRDRRRRLGGLVQHVHADEARHGVGPGAHEVLHVCAGQSAWNVKVPAEVRCDHGARGLVDPGEAQRLLAGAGRSAAATGDLLA
jgi:hypothetical protein